MLRKSNVDGSRNNNNKGALIFGLPQRTVAIAAAMGTAVCFCGVIFIFYYRSGRKGGSSSVSFVGMRRRNQHQTGHDASDPTSTVPHRVPVEITSSSTVSCDVDKAEKEGKENKPEQDEHKDRSLSPQDETQHAASTAELVEVADAPSLQLQSALYRTEEVGKEAVSDTPCSAFATAQITSTPALTFFSPSEGESPANTSTNGNGNGNPGDSASSSTGSPWMRTRSLPRTAPEHIAVPLVASTIQTQAPPPTEALSAHTKNQSTNREGADISGIKSCSSIADAEDGEDGTSVPPPAAITTITTSAETANPSTTITTDSNMEAQAVQNDCSDHQTHSHCSNSNANTMTDREDARGSECKQVLVPTTAASTTAATTTAASTTAASTTAASTTAASTTAASTTAATTTAATTTAATTTAATTTAATTTAASTTAATTTSLPGREHSVSTNNASPSQSGSLTSSSFAGISKTHSHHEKRRGGSFCRKYKPLHLPSEMDASKHNNNSNAFHASPTDASVATTKSNKSSPGSTVTHGYIMPAPGTTADEFIYTPDLKVPPVNEELAANLSSTFEHLSHRKGVNESTASHLVTDEVNHVKIIDPQIPTPPASLLASIPPHQQEVPAASTAPTVSDNNGTSRPYHVGLDSLFQPRQIRVASYANVRSATARSPDPTPRAVAIMGCVTKEKEASPTQKKASSHDDEGSPGPRPASTRRGSQKHSSELQHSLSSRSSRSTTRRSDTLKKSYSSGEVALHRRLSADYDPRRHGDTSTSASPSQTSSMFVTTTMEERRANEAVARVRKWEIEKNKNSRYKPLPVPLPVELERTAKEAIKFPEQYLNSSKSIGSLTYIVTSSTGNSNNNQSFSGNGNKAAANNNNNNSISGSNSMRQKNGSMASASTTTSNGGPQQQPIRMLPGTYTGRGLPASAASLWTGKPSTQSTGVPPPPRYAYPKMTSRSVRTTSSGSGDDYESDHANDNNNTKNELNDVRRHVLQHHTGVPRLALNGTSNTASPSPKRQ